ncbi:hypothetical protein [Janthinobacterium violaceinigrum]|uniref:Uncharacterized protein n=1 Tax=Janthinobacterium violaceinigrum TaxID=2654252 RepID=A0A6I1I6S2_9BURK|nr:hypothetical protein [Janthinobacterium violaceinigrum]KAB8065720.1 hypothetical protein GCN75_05590 [Janthinobacterium violaceinigrum]
MNAYTQKQMMLQQEIMVLLNCRLQIRDLWRNNLSPELFSAMDTILVRLKIAEQELDTVIAARNLEENLSNKVEVPHISLRLKI